MNFQSTNRVLVSVIIPHYNLGEYLDEAVESVLSQTYVDLEVIIVDDGSTDELSKKSIEKYIHHNDKRLRLYQKANEGLAATRNFGIEKSSGKYICCLDADDKYHPEFIEKCLKFLQNNPQCSFVTTWFQPFGMISGAESIVMIKKDRDLMLVKNVPHVASMFTKQSWVNIGGYDESMLHGKEDYDFWLSNIEAGYDYEVLEDVLFYYRVRAGSMLRSNTEFEETTYEYILKKHEKLFQILDIKKALMSARKTIKDFNNLITQLKVEKQLLESQLDTIESELSHLKLPKSQGIDN